MSEKKSLKDNYSYLKRMNLQKMMTFKESQLFTKKSLEVFYLSFIIYFTYYQCFHFSETLGTCMKYKWNN